MFAHLEAALTELHGFNRDFDPDRLDGLSAAQVIERSAEIERLAVGIRLLAARRIDRTVTGANQDAADWLADATGQTKGDAAKDLETSEQLSDLGATEQAVRDGQLSADQAREVASASKDDPRAERDLLDTAQHASVAELKRKAKATRAAATDDAEKNRRAHRTRDVAHGTDEETGAGWLHIKGPAAAVAGMVSALEPFTQAEFKRARLEGRYESRGAYAFDGCVALFQAAAAGTGSAASPKARVIARADITALRRGHAVAGETCDIEGVGPVPVDALRELLPQAAVDVIVTDGQDVFNVTSFSRRPNIRQQIVLHWLGVECQRLGCSATHHLEIDHEIDWATTKVTELRHLGWLCTPDHRLKTHQGWALVPGRGKRPMVPPDHPDHPANAPPDTNAA